MSRLNIATLITAVVTVTPVALAQKVEWLPVGADADVEHTIEGNEIIIPAGTPVYEIELEVRASEWSQAVKRCTYDARPCDVDGDCIDGGTCEAPELGAAQAGLDANGLLGANSSVPNSTDLVQIDAYQTRNTCHPPCFVSPCSNGVRCDTSQCLPGVFCLDNPNLLFAYSAPLMAVSTATTNTIFGITSLDLVCLPDLPQLNDFGVLATGYFGTLILSEPTGTAMGTYTIGFDPATWATFLLDCEGVRIAHLTRIPALITFEMVACCRKDDSTYPAVATCIDNVFPDDCTGPDESAHPGRTCAEVEPCFEEAQSSGTVRRR